MASNNILDHLQYLKIFADFKRSEVTSFEAFWKQIKSGELRSVNGELIQDYNYYCPEPGNSDSGDGSSSASLRDWSVDYKGDVHQAVLRSAIRDDSIDIFQEISPEQLIKIVLNNFKLQEFLSINKDIIQEYLKSWQKIAPEVEKTTNNPYPRLFTDKGYQFYQILKEEFINNKDDFAFVFRKMVDDGFIYDDIKQSVFTDFVYATEEVEIEKVKTLHQISSQKRNSLYTQLKDTFLTRR